jgi:hypothetical protein
MNTGSSWRKALVACVTLAPALAQWQLVHSIPVPQLPIPFGTFRQVYDPDRQAVLLLGPATFAYDGASLATVTSLPPPASTAAFLAYDDRRHRAVWFDDVTQQTWELAGGTGSTWQRVVTAHAPTNRDGAMVYHARAGVCVYYGGYTGSFTSSSVETWHYDGVDWTLQPATGLGRQHHTMYYDSVRGVAVVYAGARGYSFTPVFDVETYDGTSWQTVGATFINPIGRLAFDPMHGRALVMTTSSVSNAAADYWELDLLTRVQRTDLGVPAMSSPSGPPTLSTLSYDEHRGRAVCMGSLYTAGVLYLGIWELRPEAGAMRFGQSCVGTSRTGATLEATVRPRLGQSLTVTMNGVQPGEVAIFAFGFSDEQDAAGPLPRTLEAIGMPTCVQLTAPDRISIGIASGTSVADSESIPNLPELLGLIAFAQGVHTAAGATPAGALTTNGLALLLGL